MKKLIMLDRDGFVVGLFQGGPKLVKRLGGAALLRKQGKRLIDGEAYEPGCEAWRWDAKKKAWQCPDVPMWAVRANGDLARRRMVFPDRLPDLPDGWQWVKQAPPGPRARWTGKKWITPKRYAVPRDGKVGNFALAYSLKDLPKGSRIAKDGDVKGGPL